MKKVILTLAIVAAAATSAFAQGLSVGAGYLNSTTTTTVGSGSSAFGMNGFYGGVGAQKDLNDLLGISTGLYYSYLTGTSSASVLGGLLSGSNKMSEHYINVPVQLNLGFDLAKGVRLFAFAGPTVNVGLISKSVATASVGGHGGSSSTDNYADNSNYGRFDVLLGGGAGIKVANFKIFGGYNYGMLDRNKTADTAVHRSEIVVGVSFCM